MKSLLIFCMALLAIVGVAGAQDTTRNPVIQDDPSLKQSSHELQQNLLQDMVKITSKKLPEAVKSAVATDEFKGSKAFYKNKKKDEYAVEVIDGEVTSIHFFDKEGKPINKRE